MKNLPKFLRVLMLLSLLLFFSPGAYAQSARNPKQDIELNFARNRERGQFGSLYGEVKNKSANYYPCVRLEFNLYGPGPNPADTGPHIGVLTVELRNVRPGSMRNYSQPFPYAVQVTSYKSTSECSAQGNGSSTPPPAGFCSISGVIELDKRTYSTMVGLFSDDGSRRRILPAVKAVGGRYRFARVPEGQYLVIPTGRYPTGSGRSGGLGPRPQSKTVTCEPNGSPRVDFKIDSWEG